MSDTPETTDPKPRRWKRPRTILIAVLAAVAVLVGSAAVYAESVPTPTIPLYGEPTVFTYADGTTEVAGYGEAYRRQVDAYEDLPQSVVDSVIAMQDPDYFDSGSDALSVIGRIFSGDWSATITERYVRLLAEGGLPEPATVAAARKMEQDYSKEEILLGYLNRAYYGRGAHGIEAAALVWFDKPLADLSYAEAVLLAAQMEAPSGGLDPRVEPDAALERWNEGMDALVEGHYLDRAAREAAEPPETSEVVDARGTWGGDTPTGFITNAHDGYVFAELESRYGLTMEELYGERGGTGGYTVVLTLDPQIQQAVVESASRGPLRVATDEEGNFLNEDGEVVESRSEAAPMVDEDGYIEFENTNEAAALYDFDPSMGGAVVAVEPSTGAVLGYYGGEDGTGVDRAGFESPHPAGALFHMITAATAIEHGASIESMWDASSPRAFESLNGGEIVNGTQVGEAEMTLADAVRETKYTAMYAVAEKYGATAVLKTAVDMGLRSLTRTVDGAEVTYRFYQEGDTVTYSRHGVVQNEDGGYVVDESGRIDQAASIDGYDTEGEPVRTVLDPAQADSPFDYHIAFGQFPTSVKDMAAVYATIANDGVYNETHYVAAVYDRDGNEVPPVRELRSRQALEPGIARDLQYVGREIGLDQTLQRDSFGLYATWESALEHPETGESVPAGNAHSWYAGAIPQLSAAAWVGNATGDWAPIFGLDGSTSGTYGSTVAYPLWYDVLDRVLAQKAWEAVPWAGPEYVGEPITDDVDG